MIQIQLTNIEGAVYPVDVYISDIYGNNQSLLTTIITGPVPPTITFDTTIPSIFDTAPEVMLKLVDANQCETFHILPCILPSPTPTNTPTVTPTPTITPTNASPTPTPTMTPTPTQLGFYAYVFPEPQDNVSQNNLGQFMFDSGAISFFGFGNNGGPAAGPTYSTDMSIYAQYPGWTGTTGNFITNVSTLSSEIRQLTGAGTDSYGCSQNQYTFGSIPITPSQVNDSEQYTYTVWIPLNGVGGSMNNMTLDIGFGSACSTSVINDGIPDPINSTVNVVVPSGCAIPAGTYRILWIPELYWMPPTIPLVTTLWIKGDTKT